MNYLSDKVNSFTGDAISGVNEMHRKWKQTKTGTNSHDKQQEPTTTTTTTTTSAIDNNEQANTQHDQMTSLGSTAPAPGLTTSNTRQQQQQQRRVPYYARSTMVASGRSPLAGGIPFGGDSFASSPSHKLAPPPSIGFIIGPPASGGLVSTIPTVISQGPDLTNIELAESTSEQTQKPTPQRPPRAAKNQLQLAESSESLYEADAWARLWFPRVMILCLLRMLLFIRKVYEDFHATKVYNLTGQTGYLLISALTLLLPTLVFTLYRVSRYLQLVLPDIRLASKVAAHNCGGRHQNDTTTSGGAAPAATSGDRKDEKRPIKRQDDESGELTRALMTSSPESMASALGEQGNATPTSGEDGLVTARQSPVGADSDGELGDQISPQKQQKQQQQQQQQPTLASVPVASEDAKTSSSVIVRPSPTKLESVNVDKFGNLPDKDTVRVVLGASEQFLHGILFVFWQLKRQVDVMGYLVERACLWRKPAEREKEELARLRTGSDGLEWFQDFYAAFLAILAQVYMLASYWGPGDVNNGRAPSLPPVDASQLSVATNGLNLGPNQAAAATPMSDSARIVSSFIGTQTLAAGAGRDVLLVSELVVSSAVILSLLICVRRRDDGPLTLGLSMFGWAALFAARILAIGLAFVHLGWRIMTPLVMVHLLAITGWIYTIALASHNDSPSERLDEAQWDPEVGCDGQLVDTSTSDNHDDQRRPTSSSEPTTSVGAIDANELELEERKSNENANVSAGLEKLHTGGTAETSTWSLAEHLTLLTQIIILFAIPSLFYWPIMFNLKLHLRPFKYLVLILSQNFLLIPAIWYTISNGYSQVDGSLARGQATQLTLGQLYLLGAIAACSVVGFIFVSLYVACKPSLTEYFARADELFNEAEQSGIYYEFCSRVFKLADLSKQTFRRLMDQSEELVEERYELVVSSKPITSERQVEIH